MFALTVYQPWASLIAVGAKVYETRGWQTGFRGRLAIHAGKSVPEVGMALMSREPFFSLLRKGGAFRGGSGLPTGAIVAVADVVACVRTEKFRDAVDGNERALGDWSGGRFAWELSNVIALAEPVRCRGLQGLWRVGGEATFQVERQLLVPGAAEADEPLAAGDDPVSLGAVESDEEGRYF